MMTSEQTPAQRLVNGEDRQSEIVAAGVMFANAILPFLVLIHALHWEAEQLAGAMPVVSTGAAFVSLALAKRRHRTIADRAVKASRLGTLTE